MDSHLLYCSSKSGNTSLFAYDPFVGEQTMNNPFEIPSFDDIGMAINSMNAFQYHQRVFNTNKLNKENRNRSLNSTVTIESGKSNSRLPIPSCIPSPSSFDKKIKLTKNEIFSLQPLSMDQDKEKIRASIFSQENVLGSLSLNLRPSKEPFQISSVITFKEKGQCLKICNVIKILIKYYKLCDTQVKAKSLMKTLRLESASKLGMKKKTLDDYAMFLKWGIRLGFPFEECLNKKFGSLRSWVKENPKFTGKKTSLRHEFNSVNLINEIHDLNSKYLKSRKTMKK